MLASIHRAAPCAIGVVADRIFQAVNAQMCKMSGYGEDELIGKSARMLYATQSEFERVGKEKYSMMEKRRVGTIETQWQTKDGRIIDVLLSSTPMDGLDLRNGVTFTATDITIQKESEREKAKIISSLGNIVADRTRWLNENNKKLQKEIAKRGSIEKKLRASKKELENTILQVQKSQAQIIQSEKMASIGQLAAGVAHEINNPTAFVSSNLTTMTQYQREMTQLLESYETVLSLITRSIPELPGPVGAAVDKTRALAEEIDLAFMREDFPELIGESKEGTERIRKIVADLKDFAHPGQKQRVETDINQGLESTINIVWNEIKYKSELIRDYHKLPPVLCYSQQINQVFMNLLINAAQSIEKDGLIRVSTLHDNGQVLVKI
ncbi:MAG: PAS domain S-box protein, partial [Desulfobacteraceae bacterium]